MVDVTTVIAEVATCQIIEPKLKWKKKMWMGAESRLEAGGIKGREEGETITTARD